MKFLLVFFCLLLPAYGVAALCEIADKELCDKAEQGDAMAQFNLGAKYHHGDGVKQNFRKAKTWYEKSAEQGDAFAQYNLGVMYLDGEGVRPDDGKAKELFGRACDNGSTLGCESYRDFNDRGL